MALRGPTGTVTFLFTDIEGSTGLWQDHFDAMATALALHDGIVRSVIADHDGFVFATGGDGFAAAFARAADAVVAAVDIQARLGAAKWPHGAAIRVRIGLHTGEAVEREGDYFGPAVNRTARLMAAAHGGQVVASSATQEVLADRLPEGVRFEHLGMVAAKGFSESLSIFGVVELGREQRFPPLRGASPARGAQPPAPDLIVGRSSELREIADLLSGHRVVTLTGAGGVGKTTLAASVANTVAHRFPDGVWWVDLAAVGRGEAITEVVASIVGVRDHLGIGVLHALATALADQQMLLVLDNCEHVLEEATSLVGYLIGRCPDLFVLSTSRMRLGLSAERDLPIRPLATDGDNSVAFELLVQRIGRSDVTNDATEQAGLIDICRRLDGLPLALELAAARCRTMSPSAVAKRLSQRIRLPEAQNRGGGQRSTLEGTVAWSFDLLSPVQQRIFARLSVFAGAFSLDAAEQVAVTTNGPDPVDEYDVDDAVAALVEQSLVEFDGDRYRMLETTREFGRDRLAELGETSQLELAHIHWTLEFLRRARLGMRTSDELLWIDRLDTEWGNVRAAFHRAFSRNDPSLSSELVVLLFIEAGFRRPEPVTWIVQAAERDGARPHSHQRELIAANGWLKWERGDPHGALEGGRLAVEIDPEPGTALERLPEWTLVAGLSFTGRGAEARRVVEQALATVQDDPYLHVIWLYLFTLVCATDGQPEAGIDASLRAERIATTLGNPTALAFGLWARGNTLFATDRLRHINYLEQSLVYGRKARLVFFNHALEAALLGARRGAIETPAESLENAIRQAREHVRTGLMWFAWTALIGIAECLSALGRPQDAALCCHAIERSPIGDLGRTRTAPLRATLAESLGEQEMARLAKEAHDLDFAALLNLAESQP